jgi:hypothetical protein
MSSLPDRRSFENRRDFLPQFSLDAYILEQFPEFLNYLFFHSVLDKYCWLIKLHYSPREVVRSKRYRLDELLQHFLLSNKIALDKIRRGLPAELDKKKLEHHLTKGWYNELIRSDPVIDSYLSIGTSLGKDEGPGSGGLIAWNIIQSYYAFYEFLCCCSSSFLPKLDTRGHKAVAKAFSNQLLGKTKNRILFYPLNLTSSTTEEEFPNHPSHCFTQYAVYPREDNKRVSDLEREIPKAFALLGSGGKKSILDFLYELRLWANYTGLQSLVKLTDGGYQQFLVRNLATVTFFSAAVAELTAISAVGEGAYLALVSQFAEDFIEKHDRFSRRKPLLPLIVRLKVYNHLELLSVPAVMLQPSDPIRLISLPGKPR